ncbi:hypothetical protein [uncultured Legionella sp.]|uniref:hypothetical protein n=1 Tax=uncultured Legionella sp. TaxID=210934 RepID=UPI002623A768|nr:hypothetical protein [uncultured Legionella sp.]
MKERKEINTSRLSTSFEHFFTGNKIDRKILVEAFNSAQSLGGINGERTKFKSIYELNNVLTEIDAGNKENYRIAAHDRLGNMLDKYKIPKIDENGLPLPYSKQLIYEALLWHYETELTISMEHLNNRLVDLSRLPGDHSDEIIKLKNEIGAISTQETQRFAARLQKTGGTIDDTVFTTLYDFFTTPSLASDIAAGIGVGLLTVGAIAAALVLSIGTAGVAPAVFGVAAAATLGAAATGLSLSAVGIGIVGLITAVSVGIGEYVRSKSTESLENQSVIQNPQSKNDIPQSSTGLMNQLGLSLRDKPAVENTAEPEIIRVKTSNIEQKDSEIVQLSQKLILELEQYKIFDVPVACDYVKDVINIEKSNFVDKDEQIERKIDKLKQITSHIKDTYPAKDLLNKYIEEIRPTPVCMSFQC